MITFKFHVFVLSDALQLGQEFSLSIYESAPILCSGMSSNPFRQINTAAWAHEVRPLCWYRKISLPTTRSASWIAIHGSWSAPHIIRCHQTTYCPCCVLRRNRCDRHFSPWKFDVLDPITLLASWLRFVPRRSSRRYLCRENLCRFLAPPIFATIGNRFPSMRLPILVCCVCCTAYMHYLNCRVFVLL